MPDYAFILPPYQAVVIYRAAGNFLTDLIATAAGDAAGALTLTLPAGSYQAVAAGGLPGTWPGVEILPSMVEPIDAPSTDWTTAAEPAPLAPTADDPPPQP